MLIFYFVTTKKLTETYMKEKINKNINLKINLKKLVYHFLTNVPRQINFIL